ncbi:MAG TPA: hypothetical protein ENG03_05265 [Thioploca sp.]|nr:MAG: hypothetical protein DRR19_05280 [Gammaproteobacteria bacterium]HDN26495.1 hypothetical protein [Thioploca sp.]
MKKLKQFTALTIMAAATTATAETLPLCEPGFCENLENVQYICAARQEALVPLVVDPKTSCMCDCAAILVKSNDTLSLIAQKRTVKVLPHIQVEAPHSYWRGYGKVTKPYNYSAPTGWVILEAVFETTYQNGDAGLIFLDKHQNGFDLLSLDEINRAYDAAIAYLHQQDLPKSLQNRLTRKIEKKRRAHRKALFKANIGFSAIDYAVYAQGAGYYSGQPAEIKGYLKVTEQYVGNDSRTLRAALMRYVEQEVAVLQQQ